MGIISQIKNVWNIFTNKNQTVESTFTYTTRPSRVFWRSGQERSILASIYNRIAVDASTFDIKHVKLNSENHYEKDIQSPINTVLTLTANQDQDGRSLIMDAVYSLLEEGCVAIVPVDADRDPFKHTINNVYSMRVAQIVEWHRNTIGIMLYNERSGQRERVLIP